MEIDLEKIKKLTTEVKKELINTYMKYSE